jgi:murein DD-endopeptidase MepM/ murein hydrolase activator NlpD
LGDYIKAKPAVVKLVGDWGMASTVPAGVLVVGRKHQGDYDAQHQYRTGQNPAAAARVFVQDQMATYKANPHITYWEGHNEPVWNSQAEMTWYAQFEVERMQLMAGLDLKCVIGNFATGNPDLPLWASFVSACQAGREYEALLGLHEYSCPWMWWMTGNYQLNPAEDEGDEGWTTLRYRKIYRQYLMPNDAAIPLVITECGIDPLVSPKPQGCSGGTWKQLGDYWKAQNGETDKADFYYRQLVWYDQELQKDDYVVGATVFCWGNYGTPWSNFDVAGTDVAKKLVAYTQANPAEDFSYTLEGDERGVPRAQYERTYVLMPPDAGAALTKVVVDETWNQERWTIGASADDAGIGDLDMRRVIAISPGKWPGDLKAFFEEHYAGVDYWPLDYDNEYQLKGRLLAYSLLESGFSLGYPTTYWPPYVTGEFGTWRGTYHHMGLDLRSSYRVRGDEVLSATDGIVTAAGYYDNAGGFGYRVNVQTKAPDGRAVHVRYAHLVAGGIYVKVGDQVTVGQKLGQPDSTGTSSGDHLHFDVKVGGSYADPALLIRWEKPGDTSTPQNFPLLGLHGRGGGEYLASQGVKGWCVDPVYMNEDYQALNYSALADVGVRVVVNLRRSWSTDCGGQGTIPPPDKWARFIENAVKTILNSKGVYAYELFNEVNNPREWPPGYQVKPQDVAYLYNEIYRQTKDFSVLVGLGALDPYYGPGSDCREWFRYLMANITGAKFIGLHGYGRGPNVAKLDSDMKFGNDPLKWQYAAYFKCIQTFIDEIPSRFASVPLFVTECNHLWLEDAWWTGTIGWKPDAADWIQAAFDIAAKKPRVTALVFYRWSGDDWHMDNKPKLLQKIVELNR